MKRRWMESIDGEVCPRIQEKLEIAKEIACTCTPMPSTNNHFQVKHGLDELAVDLEKRTCTCRRWQLTGIPCAHRVSCISFLRLTTEDFVADCYKRDAFFKCYGGKIAPLMGERHWEVVDLPLNPPPIKIGPGRPKKNMRKDPHEDPKRPGKLTKHGFQMTCSRCKGKWHTKRKCRATEVTEAEPAPKRPRGRPANHDKASSSGVSHHDATAQPANGGRGRGRQRRNGGHGVASRGGKGRRNKRVMVPTGVGLYTNENGAQFLNVLFLIQEYLHSCFLIKANSQPPSPSQYQVKPLSFDYTLVADYLRLLVMY